MCFLNAFLLSSFFLTNELTEILLVSDDKVRSRNFLLFCVSSSKPRFRKERPLIGQSDLGEIVLAEFIGRKSL